MASISAITRCRSAAASGSICSEKPRSNSLPWLPTRRMDSGDPVRADRSRSERPEMSTTCVFGIEAMRFNATIVSRCGNARFGSLTIGARVPS